MIAVCVLRWGAPGLLHGHTGSKGFNVLFVGGAGTMSLVVGQSVSGIYEDCRGNELLFSCDVWVRECERVQIDVLCARQAKEPNPGVLNRAAETVMFNAVLGLAFLAQKTSFHSLETCRRGPRVPCCEKRASLYPRRNPRL